MTNHVFVAEQNEMTNITPEDIRLIQKSVNWLGNSNHVGSNQVAQKLKSLADRLERDLKIETEYWERVSKDAPSRKSNSMPPHLFGTPIDKKDTEFSEELERMTCDKMTVGYCQKCKEVHTKALGVITPPQPVEKLPNIFYRIKLKLSGGTEYALGSRTGELIMLKINELIDRVTELEKRVN